jgi:hypothetical protein
MGFVSSMWAAQAVATFAKLGVADLLAAGPKTAAELSAETKTHPQALHRLLRGVASVGVLSTEVDGRFGLTPIGECLRADVPGSMRSFLIAELSAGHWLPWGQLERAVRTGQPSTVPVLGMGAWEYYKQNPEEGAHFAKAMSGVSAMAMHAVLAVYSFAGARKVVDVGGSHGVFLSAVLKQERDARGVLFDLPEVVKGAGDALAAEGVLDRVERVGGSFFDAVPSGGDVYLLKFVLHDWSDEECVRILTNVREAMAADAKVVVVEMPIVPEGPPSPAPLLDLNMLVMLTGKERTPDEYAALFARAGLRLSGVTPTPSPFAVLEARRA